MTEASDGTRQAVAKAIWLHHANTGVPPEIVEEQWARMLKLGPDDDSAGEWGGWAAHADAAMAALKHVLTKVSAIHEPETVNSRQVCAHDGWLWPCPTQKALKQLG